MKVIVAFLATLFSVGTAFYLPGLAANDFQTKSGPINVYVDKLTSPSTLVPYDYYELGHCKPRGGVKHQDENLGQFLTGHRIESSPYTVTMHVAQECTVTCLKQYGKKDLKHFKHMIKENYFNHWILDNLPSASIDGLAESVSWAHGFRVGYIDPDSGDAILYNDVELTVQFHPVGGGTKDDPKARIVGFLVEPRSRAYSPATIQALNVDKSGYTDSKPDCVAPTNEPMRLKLESGATKLDVLWTYSVKWEASETLWATRWDVYLDMGGRYPDGVHIFNIINSLLVVLFLSAMLGLLVRRNVYRDLERYERVPTEAERQEDKEDFGWKLVHADVFRTPHTHPMLFCVLVGSGTQLTACAFLTVIFAAVGFLSPATRGLLMIALLLLYVLMGSLAGYTAARTYKMFRGKQWQRCTILTSLFFPGIAFVVFFILNLCLWGAGSSGAVPFRSMFAVLALWLCISVPLVYFGAYFGFRKPAMEHPVATSNIPRAVPDQPWYSAAPLMVLCAGILPFGAVFVELFFGLSSATLGNSYYYVYGFLLIVVVIMLVTAAEITVVLIYFQLCSEDYHWWWRSLFMGGASGLYVFLYSIFFFASYIAGAPGADMMALTATLFIGYSFLFSFAISLITGCVGYGASLIFLRAIFKAVKVD